MQLVYLASPLMRMYATFFLWVFTNLFLIFQIYDDISLEVILYGNDNLIEDQNVNIFNAVLDHIERTHRFNWRQQVLSLILLST